MNLQQALSESEGIAALATFQGHRLSVMEQLGPFHALQIDEGDLEQFDTLVDLENRLHGEFPEYQLGDEIWEADA